MTDSTLTKAAGPGNSYTREVSCYENSPSVPRRRLDPDTLVLALFCADDNNGSENMDRFQWLCAELTSSPVLSFDELQPPPPRSAMGGKFGYWPFYKPVSV